MPPFAWGAGAGGLGRERHHRRVHGDPRRLFTALYGSDRPYLNRSGHLAVVALTLGVGAAQMPLLVVPTVVAISMVATLLCDALRVGPPGAYMFALACAAGTAMPTGHLTVPQIGLLVFAGGSIAWLAHMAGAFFSPRGPERAAVIAAARAVARFVETVGTPGEDGARHSAGCSSTAITHRC